MAELWVAVDADAGDDVSFHRVRDALDAGADGPRTARGFGARVPIAEVVGMVTLLYGRALRMAPDGDVAGVPDGALERWACWEGEPGIFAQAFRAHFTDGGKIVTWEEVAGRLLKYREKEAERKRLARERERLKQSGGLSADAVVDHPLDAPGTVRGSSTGLGAGRAHSDSDSDSDLDPTSAPAPWPSHDVEFAVRKFAREGHIGERWFIELTQGEQAELGVPFWRAMQRIADAHGAPAVAFYLEDLHKLASGRVSGEPLAIAAVVRGLDQFSTDAAKVKRQTFLNWISGAANPSGVPGLSTGNGSSKRVDPRDVFDDTVSLLRAAGQ